MEVLFENSFTRDEELAKELCTYLHFRRPFMIVFFAVMLAIVDWLAYMDIMYGMFTWFGYAFAALYVGLKFYQYFTSVKRMMARDAEAGMDNIVVSSTVTEDALQYHSLGSTCPAVELTHMKRWVTTKNYIFLCSKTKMLYCFSKKGFTKGSEEAFYQFLTEKGISHGR